MKTYHSSNPTPQHPQWSQLLQDAVTKPGTISEAYSRFHGYSLGNQIAALYQCHARGIQPGPIATFPKWQELGRFVKRGEKAIVLCQPVTVKNRDAEAAEASDSPESFRTVFIWRPRWFVLAQTDGEELEAAAFVPSWDRSLALQTLEITEAAFELTDGNTQGYARGRAIAINPVATMPVKTTFHELAHVVLGHTVKGEAADGSDLPRNLREVEAEATALLCLESLQLPGGEFCRGYIQHWIGSGQTIPETSAQRIFGAADAILRAGSGQAVRS